MLKRVNTNIRDSLTDEGYGIFSVMLKSECSFSLNDRRIAVEQTGVRSPWTERCISGMYTNVHQLDTDTDRFFLEVIGGVEAEIPIGSIESYVKQGVLPPYWD